MKPLVRSSTAHQLHSHSNILNYIVLVDFLAQQLFYTSKLLVHGFSPRHVLCHNKHLNNIVLLRILVQLIL